MNIVRVVVDVMIIIDTIRTINILLILPSNNILLVAEISTIVVRINLETTTRDILDPMVDLHLIHMDDPFLHI